MIKVTQQQKLNQLSAKEMWLTVPTENVSWNLGDWREDNHFNYKNSPPSCGTIACFGGWCAWWPYFRAQGVGSNNRGVPDNGTSLSVPGDLFGCGFLGETAFYSRHPSEKGTDWQVVMTRINRMLKNSEVAA
jgi:hypothetical protein